MHECSGCPHPPLALPLASTVFSSGVRVSCTVSCPSAPRTKLPNQIINDRLSRLLFPFSPLPNAVVSWTSFLVVATVRPAPSRHPAMLLHCRTRVSPGAQPQPTPRCTCGFLSLTLMHPVLPVTQVFSKPQLLAALARVEKAAAETYGRTKINLPGSSPWETLVGGGGPRCCEQRVWGWRWCTGAVGMARGNAEVCPPSSVACERCAQRGTASLHTPAQGGRRGDMERRWRARLSCRDVPCAALAG